MHEAVAFPSGENELRGRLYSGSANAPRVVMAHGTSATTTMVADVYAKQTEFLRRTLL